MWLLIHIWFTYLVEEKSDKKRFFMILWFTFFRFADKRYQAKENRDSTIQLFNYYLFNAQLKRKRNCNSSGVGNIPRYKAMIEI